jgi:hypothetical protein
MPKVDISLGSPIYLNSIRDSAEPIEGLKFVNGNLLSKCRLEVRDFDTSCAGLLGLVRRFQEIVPPNRSGIPDTPVKLMQSVNR